MDDFDVRIGEHIKAVRISRGLTQEQLAERAELSTNHISKLERGLCSVSLKCFCKICQVLQTSLNEIVYQNHPDDVDAARDGTDGVSFDVNQIVAMESRLKEVLSVIEDSMCYRSDVLK
ncbi:MAG: helix-turn-helix transcriptional regulator [Firmicutes bacterium]|nr:helix-turn-helix transcriptional regulator [Bacillota bacterium]